MRACADHARTRSACCARRERPRSRRAPEQSDKLPSPHFRLRRRRQHLIGSMSTLISAETSFATATRGARRCRIRVIRVDRATSVGCRLDHQHRTHRCDIANGVMGHLGTHDAMTDAGFYYYLDVDTRSSWTHTVGCLTVIANHQQQEVAGPSWVAPTVRTGSTPSISVRPTHRTAHRQPQNHHRH